MKFRSTLLPKPATLLPKTEPATLLPITATMSKQQTILSKGRNFTIESFDIVAIGGNKVECCFDKLERCFDNVACCFDRCGQGLMLCVASASRRKNRPTHYQLSAEKLEIEVIIRVNKIFQFVRPYFLLDAIRTFCPPAQMQLCCNL